MICVRSFHKTDPAAIHRIPNIYLYDHIIILTWTGGNHITEQVLPEGESRPQGSRLGDALP
jgi:hypothetical protein